MSKAMYNINRNSTDHFYRYKMPAITTKIEGKGNGIKTVVENCCAIAIALNRPPEYVCKNFGFELGAQVQMDAKKEKYIVNGAHSPEMLQDKLDIFIRNWVLCEKCENPETSLTVDKKDKKNPDIFSECKACGIICELKHQGRMRKYIQINPPEKFNMSDKGTAAANTGKKDRNKHKSSTGGGHGDDNAGDENNNLDSPSSPQIEVEGWGEDDDLKSSVDLEKRIDRFLQQSIVSQLGDLALADTGLEKTISNLDVDKKIEIFHRHIKRIKKKYGKEDFYSEDAAIELARISKNLQLGAYSVIGFQTFVEFSKSFLDQIDKYSMFLKAFCEDDKKTQKTMCGVVEMVVKEHSKKLLPYVAHIFKKLYDLDIVEDDVILEWSKKPSKKFTSKKFVEKMVGDPGMVKLLDWLEQEDESSSESESEDEDEEEDDDDNDEGAQAQTPVVNGNVEQVVPEVQQNGVASEEEDDEEIDIDGI